MSHVGVGARRVNSDITFIHTDNCDTLSHTHPYPVKTAERVDTHYMSHRDRSGKIDVGTRIEHNLMLVICTETAAEPSAVDIGKRHIESVAIAAFLSVISHLKPQIGIRIVVGMCEPEPQRSSHKRIIVMKSRVDRQQAHSVAISPPAGRQVGPAAVITLPTRTRGNRHP